MTPESAYGSLVDLHHGVALLHSCSALLSWDEQTYMPRGGAGLRGEQMALLAGLAHERATDPRIGDWLSFAEGSPPAEAETPEAADLREWRRRFNRSTRLPRTLVEQLAMAEVHAQDSWLEARREKSFARLEPALSNLVALKREQAACWAPAGASGDSLYEAMVEEYDPGSGLRCRELDPFFDGLRVQVKRLLDLALGRPDRPGRAILTRSYPVDRQRWFSELAAATIGFRFDQGRLDVTEHPFCSGFGPGDCRITTRYQEHDFEDGFFSVLHETGHGLYEQGVPPGRFGRPSGEAYNLTVHESQSRFWENHIGRSRPFWVYWFPIAKRTFPGALGEVDLDAFLRAVNHVEPSLIRVRADELTYHLHVGIRYRLERAILTGDLAVKDLPAAWNEAYERDLGLVPRDDTEGCLQDIHWSAGLYGYFPTYTLGSSLAAELHKAVKLDVPGLPAELERGQAASALWWLRDRIHRHGVPGRPIVASGVSTPARLSFEPLVSHLAAKLAAG